MPPMPGQEQRAQQKFLVFGELQKMDTASARTGLPDQVVAWWENLQPLGTNKLKVVPAPAAPSTTIAETITLAYYATINGQDYAILFTSVGGGWFYNFTSGVNGQFAPDGTFSNAPDCTVWSGQRILINDSVSGYCTWDGNVFVKQGMVSPNIIITNPGANYSTPPTVTFTINSGSLYGITISGANGPMSPANTTGNLVIGAPPTGGVQASATYTIAGGVLTGVTITNPGAGYTSVPTVAFPGTVTGTKPTLTAVMTQGTPPTGVTSVSGGQVTGITLTNPGSGILPTDIIAITFGTTSGSGAQLTPVMSTSSVTGITLGSAGLWNLGQGNPTSSGNPYALVFNNTGTGGSGASGQANLMPANPSGQVMVSNGGTGNPAAPSVTAGGTGYLAAPTVSWDTTNHPINLAGSPGPNSLPTFTATMSNIQINSITIGSGGSNYPVSSNIPLVFKSPAASTIRQARATATTDPTGTITGIVFQDHGSYLPGTKVTATVQAGSGAAASAHGWPLLPKGTTIAVFQGRVWLNGLTSSGYNLLQWSGTGGPALPPTIYGGVAYDDFSQADASGSLQIVDADLVHQISCLRSFNNYLLIIGDQSVKQIGNISVTAGSSTSASITVFQLVTLSSDQGTIWPKSAISFNRIAMFANPNGIFGIFGSTVQKISDDLDGIFQALDRSVQPQGAIVDLNSRHNAAFLVRYIDPVAGTRTLLCLFDGKKWWLGNQGSGLGAIMTFPQLSSDINTLWGSVSGTDWRQLFADAATAQPFKLSTSLSAGGNPVQGKKALRAGFTADATSSANVTITMESEGASQANALAVTPTSLLVGGANDANNQPINTAGVYIGATLTGTFAGFILQNVIIEYQETSLWKGA